MHNYGVIIFLYQSIQIMHVFSNYPAEKYLSIFCDTSTIFHTQKHTNFCHKKKRKHKKKKNLHSLEYLKFFYMHCTQISFIWNSDNHINTECNLSTCKGGCPRKSFYFGLFSEVRKRRGTQRLGANFRALQRACLRTAAGFDWWNRDGFFRARCNAAPFRGG